MPRSSSHMMNSHSSSNNATNRILLMRCTNQNVKDLHLLHTVCTSYVVCIPPHTHTAADDLETPGSLLACYYYSFSQEVLASQCLRTNAPTNMADPPGATILEFAGANKKLHFGRASLLIARLPSTMPSAPCTHSHFLLLIIILCRGAKDVPAVRQGNHSASRPAS